MKKLLLISLLLFMTQQLFSQAPQQFSFQGVARDAAGKAIYNATVGLRLTIRSESANGTTVYQETHNAQTGPGATFTVKVRTGTVTNGTFADITWAAKSYFLQVEIDPAGGSNYTNIGATQLLSVPYALHAAEAGKWKDGDPIVQTGKALSSPTLPAVPKGSTLIWYPRKSSFRIGYVDNDAWDSNQTGQQSFAFGRNTVASGLNSMSGGDQSTASGFCAFSMGDFAIASGQTSIAAGRLVKAVGAFSVAMGYDNESLGFASFSMGNNVVAKSKGSTTLGSFNDESDNPSQGGAQSDRLFQIGNGSVNARSNALTVLRNGNIGLGKAVLAPQFILDIEGRIRIRRGAESAGLWLNNSSQEAKTFIGMQTDTQVGFYIGDDWRFSVNTTGQGRLNGSLIQTSDRRLKKNFSSLTNSLSKVNQIQGYHFIWKDPKMEQSIQTGFIAQEVETIFPELVKTDDKGLKSVNYIGFIPHLIESVKDLKKENEDLEKSVSQLLALEVKVNSLTGMLQILSAKTETTSIQTK